MTILDTLSTIDEEKRYPTRAEAAAAAAILLRCNGADLSEWTEGEWPDDDAMDAMKALVRRQSN